MEELENEPQDLSMSCHSGASSVSGADEASNSAMTSASASASTSGATAKVSFTSPKKAFMLREAASREQSQQQQSTSSSSAAPEVMVVSTEAGNQNTEEVSANVTIETTTTAVTSRKQNNADKSSLPNIPHDVLLGRWRLVLDLFGRVFVDDVGLEAGSIISELGGFPVKENKFRREMEKLRNSRTVDLTLNKIDRERSQLIVQAFKEFNTHYAQNQRRASSSQPAMVVNRVKVNANIL